MKNADMPAQAVSAGGGKAQPIYTSDSFRLAVDAMCEEWDEWAEENQGTRECFEAVLRKAFAALRAARGV